MTFGRVQWYANPAAIKEFVAGGADPMFAVSAVPHVIMKVKRLFPRASKYRTGWVTMVDTPEVARDLEWLLERYPMQMGEETRERLRERAEQHRHTEQTVQEILSGARTLPLSLEPARPPRDYQVIAADLATATRRLLLADDVGLGKSMSGLLVLRNEDALPALVVCLTHLPRQWEDEIAKTFPHLRPHVIRTLEPYDPSERREFAGADPDVLIISYSKLRGWGDYLAGKVRTVIFDEAQELRRAESHKYTAAAQIADLAEYRVGLTATPVYNYGGEIHNVMNVLAPGILGSREEFAREWCSGRWHDKISVSDPAALGLYLRGEGLMLRRTRRDVGRELPDVIRVPHAVDADEDVFDELAEDAVALAELIINRARPREELFRASGEFDWRVRRATGVAKASYVATFVQMLLETDEQVVLFGWHRDVYAIWKRILAPYGPVFYTGTESPKQKHDAAQAFLSGQSRVLVMSLRAGAGLDGLQDAAHVAVFGELDWSPGMHDQCIGRLHRDGQDEPVVAYFLVSDHGSDPVMADVLNLKRMQSEPLRDPDTPLFEQQPDTSDRVRRLAVDVLQKRRRRAA